ncbi:LURP-one-related family protein [Schnuerera sp. xch1]|uniref:LURP-one-related/scramblase family protein n=1 Tax=Schnuerera sp. xch1 TaxID=2874283 RepID=UPI001CC057E7|nr:LURP-one-related family protein [Schnuerera sp. xch1]MBZ2174613.1 LURP-one-related family protein [Schnuerera sp. xch1]
MKYLIKERIFTLSDKFNIEDENGNSIYQVEGKIFSVGNKLRIYELNGKELIYIEQKILRFLPEYNIYGEGSHLAMVKKEFTFFKPKFSIESSHGKFTIDGDVFQHNFDVLKNNKPVAWVNKKWGTFSDTYCVEIMDEQDQPFILALVIVMDQIFHDGQKNNA